MSNLTDKELNERLDMGINSRKILEEFYKDNIPKNILEQFITFEQRINIIYFSDIMRLEKNLEKINRRMAKLEKSRNKN